MEESGEVGEPKRKVGRETGGTETWNRERKGIVAVVVRERERSLRGWLGGSEEAVVRSEVVAVPLRPLHRLDLGLLYTGADCTMEGSGTEETMLATKG